MIRGASIESSFNTKSERPPPIRGRLGEIGGAKSDSAARNSLEFKLQLPNSQISAAYPARVGRIRIECLTMAGSSQVEFCYLMGRVALMDEISMNCIMRSWRR
jgi:hypothetical protein